MTKLRRLPAADEVQHLYQRSLDRGIIFYTQKDRIVFTTIFYSLCKKYKIKPLGLCIMMTHFHILVVCDNQNTISAFMRDLESIFAKEYNSYYGRSGPLFGYRFGQSAKYNPKSIITIISYVYNNPVAAGLCQKAEEYKWGFLPYVLSHHPFSETHRSRRSSRKLNRAIKYARSYLAGNYYLGYELIDYLFNNLDHPETQQLIDIIVSSCSEVIDFELLTKFYGSWDLMLVAMFSNTGNEYDLKETAEGKSDKRCMNLIKYAYQFQLPSRRRHFCSLSKEESSELAISMMTNYGATRFDIERVLHICSSQVIII